MNSSSTIQAVDLFCGAGGLTRGLLDAGISVVAGIDFNDDCRYAYSHNNEGAIFIHKSVADITHEELKTLFKSREVRLLCGCAPCQTFSTMNQRDEGRRRRDGRWTLLLEFGRLVSEVKPELITMENVPGLRGKDVFEKFVSTLEDNRYHIDCRIVDCSEYGMPQRRQRLVLLASLLGEIRIPTPEEWDASPKTVEDTIKHLPKIAAGEICKTDSLHSSSKLSKMNLKRIRASVPGGTWRDWDEGLVLPCHERKEGDGYGAVYGRMKWDGPSPTITTQFYNYGSGRFGHPSQDRAISLREGALLQGFPADYQFEDPKHHLGRRAVGLLIGNAVPVGLGAMVGKVLSAHVEKFKDEGVQAKLGPQRFGKVRADKINRTSS